jgi:hypothetical protein
MMSEVCFAAPAHWERRLSSRLVVGAARCRADGVAALGVSPPVEGRTERRRSRTGGIEPPVHEAG